MLNPEKLFQTILINTSISAQLALVTQQTDRNTTVTVGCGIAMWPNNRRTLTVEWMQQ